MTLVVAKRFPGLDGGGDGLERSHRGEEVYVVGHQTVGVHQEALLVADVPEEVYARVAERNISEDRGSGGRADRYGKRATWFGVDGRLQADGFAGGAGHSGDY